jgi:transcriptional regulator of arginine metabolism
MYTDSRVCIVMKSRRQAAILEIVQHDAVHSQEQLRQLLTARGHDVTQATLSRDIRDLGLVKRAADGAYQHAGVASAPASDAARYQLHRAAREFLAGIDVSQQLLVLKTGAGQASMLAIAMDRAQLPDVLGTIAGDDTILVICRDARAARTTMAHLQGLAES